MSTTSPLIPPENGATVRMYRSGHGDCFLLAFAGDTPDKPVYVLIDCGYKPGSPGYLETPTKIRDITKSIREATGGHLDVAVITHEHQDHVNGITEKNFEGITIGETWLAWTEDPEDDLANGLRKTFNDKLVGLIEARQRLAAAGDDDQTAWIDNFLEFELGGDEDTMFDPAAARLQLAAADGPKMSMNKKSMKVFKDLAEKEHGVKYLRPHEGIHTIPGAKGLRVYALGPPRDPDQLKDLDPQGDEGFGHNGLAAASPGNYFAAAAAGQGQAPFSPRYCVALPGAQADPEFGQFFTARYGGDGIAPSFAPDPEPGSSGQTRAHGNDEVEDNPAWRRIENEWLFSAAQLALDMNNATNNASLVLAFELGKGGKVLLFAADAQRGNWVSWAKKDWTEGKKKITAKDLLSRTVLYKVGHHGSHNATLNGRADAEHPNLAWMASGKHAREFTALITAVRAWAETQKGWDHPLKAIKEALIKKASGRVFQTDTEFDKMRMTEGGSEADWQRFRSKVSHDPLYFDINITR